ncbi:MAG: dTMP kinase [Chloracidobacterium sp.]|nr:dTMP kinase [Chloracidobacterium sp.]MCO5333795.1 dTMP kinase [Pyrinomonadaceae bacterium]
MEGKFITLEGIDGSGKSTQLKMLADALRRQGIEAVTTREPGGTPLGRRLREAFLETHEAVSPIAELLLFAADRAQHVEHLIKPSLAEGKIVISDRYADATAAYQGAGRGFPLDTIAEVIRLATAGLSPDMTLFFDIPVESAVQRMQVRPDSEAKANRMDAETAEFYDRVRRAYLDIAARESDRFVVIDASHTVEEVHRKVMLAVGRLIS